MIHGDRIEAMSCAIVCATNYVLCGHIEGGEVSGTIDEALRHCNTKLAHHHFVSSVSAGERVKRLGESTVQYMLLAHLSLIIINALQV